MGLWGRVVALLLVVLWRSAVAGAQQFVEPPRVLPASLTAGYFIPLDLNGDGRTDLLYLEPGSTLFNGVTYATRTARVLTQNPDGGFRGTNTNTGFATFGGIFNSVAAAAVDANGDGRQDVYFAVTTPVTIGAFTTGSISVGPFFGDGQGALTSSGPATLIAAQGSLPPLAGAIATADFNGDGVADVAMQDSANGYLFVLLGTGGGGLRLAQTIKLADGAGPMQVLDLNGDGHPDLAVAGASGAGVQIFLGHADGSLTAANRYTGSGKVFSFLLHDMDLDGLPDLVTEGEGGRIDIYHGNGDGTFAPASEIGIGASSAATGNGGRLVSTADVNRDGFPDILTVTPGGLNVLLGGPGIKYTLDKTYDIGPGRTSFAVTDLTGDLITDFAVDAPGGVAILAGRGTGDVASKIVLTINTNPIYWGQSIDGYAQASGSDNVPLGGTLTFLDGTRVFCVIDTAPGSNCPGTAGQGFTVGTHALTVVFSGDKTHPPASSEVVNLVVLRDLTTATLMSSKNPSAVGAGVTLTATVTGNFLVPNGAVAFRDGATVLGSGALNSQGVASISTTGLAAGSHGLTAVYVGNMNFNGVTSAPLVEAITASAPRLATTTTLVSGQNPSVVNQSVTLTASVTTGGSGTAAGAVMFLEDGLLLGTVMPDGTGRATLVSAFVAAGEHTLMASYAGDATTLPSVSGGVMQVVSTTLPPGDTGFSLAITPGEASVGAGQSTTLRVIVGDVPGFTEDVQLSCTGLPTESACTFEDGMIPAGGGSTLLTVSTVSPHNCGDRLPYSAAGTGAGMGEALLAGLALLWPFGRRRGFRQLLSLVVLAGAFALGGCSRCTDLGTLPGAYTIHVMGTSTGKTGGTAFQTLHLVVTGGPR